MSLEQTDFFDKLKDDKDQKKDSDSVEEIKDEVSQEKPKMIQKPDDGLDFNCEVCQDAPGGCPSCGFGRGQ